VIKIHNRIWLQWEAENVDTEAVTWCKDKINNDDISYIRELPKWITPEKYKELIGKDWPDDGPVWVYDYYKKDCWYLDLFGQYKPDIHRVMVISNSHGKPPADFIPEE
jgi:hypothetical protein